MTPADSPENKCPGDFIGDDLSGVHTCHAGCPCHSSGGRASVPSSPHETGQKLPTSEEEFAAALLVSFEQGKVAGRRLGEGRLSPSAAPTNSESVARTDGEGEKGWIARLREQGVKAAHPDDGWVSRERCEIHLAYPYFDDGLDVGDLLALGNPGKETRIVKVLGTRENRFAPVPNGRWYFAFGHKDTDLSVGEGEGLRARIESALREVLDEQNVDLPVFRGAGL